MRRALVCVLVLAASVRCATAGLFLYATAAGKQQVDGFRLAADGTFDPNVAVQQSTPGVRPKRLLVNGCSMYVAEDDRVEVYRIGAGGDLKLVGATIKNEKMQSHDIAVAPDGSTLYVPFTKRNWIASYPLDNDPASPTYGAPKGGTQILQGSVYAGGPTSCVYGPRGNNGVTTWEDLKVANGKLYANCVNHVLVYGICTAGDLFCLSTAGFGVGDLYGTPTPDTNGDGEVNSADNCPGDAFSPVPQAPQGCLEPEGSLTERPPPTCALSNRNHLDGPTGLIVQGSMMIVGNRVAERLVGFTLGADGNFPSVCTSDFSDCSPADPPKDAKKAERKSRKQNNTYVIHRYLGLTLFTPASAEPIIYATRYEGRIDTYRLSSDLTLPKTFESNTKKDLATTPVRTTIWLPKDGSNAVLYVPGGETNRIAAYRLDADGGIPAYATPIQQTNPLTGSFPNDAVVVDTGGCS